MPSDSLTKHYRCDRFVLARRFEVAKRGDAFGLEMSFNPMLQVCITAYLTDFKAPRSLAMTESPYILAEK